MDDPETTEDAPAMNRLLLAAVLTAVGLAAVAMLVLAAAAVVYR